MRERAPPPSPPTRSSRRYKDAAERELIAGDASEEKEREKERERERRNTGGRATACASSEVAVDFRPQGQLVPLQKTRTSHIMSWTPGGHAKVKNTETDLG